MDTSVLGWALVAWLGIAALIHFRGDWQKGITVPIDDRDRRQDHAPSPFDGLLTALILSAMLVTGIGWVLLAVPQLFNQGENQLGSALDPKVLLALLAGGGLFAFALDRMD